MKSHARSVSRIVTPLAVGAMLFVTRAELRAQDYTGRVLYRLQAPPGFEPFVPFGTQVGIGNTISRDYGTGFSSGGQVVGTGAITVDTSVRHALLWSTPGALVDLHPAAGYDATACFATDGVKQVGYGYAFNFGGRALLWSGTAASVVNLHPASGFHSSFATGVGGGQQIGSGLYSNDFDYHALLWSGTADSMVDLHPASGFEESFAAATDGTHQVGYATSSVPNSGYHAVLWSGTAASVVDLHPAGGFFFNSFALGLGSNQQVGYASNVSPGDAHAMLWTGTSASHVDLHPGIGYDNSYAAAAGGGKQVGWGHQAGGFTHALLWTGTAGSIVDLHSLLPAPVGALFNSFAISIDANGNIFGIADDFAGTIYAVEWSPRQAKLVNASTRLRVLPGANVLISGFILSGSGTKSMLLRGLGPTLTQFGVADALADPTLQLQSGSGPLIASNNNWKNTQQGQIAATGKAPPNDLEPAIVHTYGPGNYTAILSGVNETSGTALMEAYGLEAGTTIQLSNISTRGFVGTGDAVMIAGFIVDGPPGSSLRVIIRGLGPTLTQFGVPDALQDPSLALRDKSGNLIAFNDNWKDTQMSAIQSTNRAPPNDHEPAIVVALPPGSYTAIESGKNNTTGVGLVEVYKMP